MNEYLTIVSWLVETVGRRRETKNRLGERAQRIPTSPTATTAENVQIE